MPSSDDELARVSSWQLANLSWQMWAIVMADRPLLMADRALRRGLGGPVGGVRDDSHPTCNTVLHQLVMGQPSHMPKADDILIKRDLKDLQQSGKTTSEASMGAFIPTDIVCFVSCF